MKTKKINIEDVTFIVPESYHAPYQTLKEFPASCGAGDGLGNTLVPETMWGLRISPACSVHDFCFEVSEGTWQDFHQSNYLFLRNLIAIIRAKSANTIMRRLRYKRALKYFTAVDETGAFIFKKMKGEVV